MEGWPVWVLQGNKMSAVALIRIVYTFFFPNSLFSLFYTQVQQFLEGRGKDSVYLSKYGHILQCFIVILYCCFHSTVVSFEAMLMRHAYHISKGNYPCEGRYKHGKHLNKGSD